MADVATNRVLVRCGDHPEHNAVFLYAGGMCAVPGPGAVLNVLWDTGVAAFVPPDGVWNAPHSTVQQFINWGWLRGPVPAGFTAPT